MRLSILTFASVLAACSNPSADKDLQQVSSWTATLAFAAEGWLGNRVPAAFVRDTIQSAQKAFEKAGSEKLPSAAQQFLRDSRDAASELNGAIQRGDRGAALRARSRLLAAHESLEKLVRQ